MNRTLTISRRFALLLLLSLSLVAGAIVVWASAATVPTTAPVRSGVTVLSNSKASVDASNLAEGYLFIAYTGGKSVRIKVQISKAGGPEYTYNLNNEGTAEVFPLTEGDGVYSVKVFENISPERYVQAYACTLTLALRNEFLPFLYSNQYVNFTADSKTVEKAAELVKGKIGALAKIKAVFDYAVDTITYDDELAKNVKSGYLPDVDKVLKSKKGICFDYAAVMTAMLRSQGVPCKLVVGHAETVYHAWISTYISGTGWVDNAIYFDGTNWTLMDPTFTSGGARSKEIMKYVTTAKNYTQKYAY